MLGLIGQLSLEAEDNPPHRPPPHRKAENLRCSGGDFLREISDRVASQALLVTMRSPLTSQGGSHVKASRPQM